MTRSAELFREANEHIPGGVNSPVRAFKAVGGDPVFFVRGEGAWLVDEDGRRYVDYVGSWGPMILGHGQQAVVEAVKTQADKALGFGAPTELEIELAEPARRRGWGGWRGGGGSRGGRSRRGNWGGGTPPSRQTGGRWDGGGAPIH